MLVLRCLRTNSHDYKDPAGERFASDFAGPIVTKLPLNSSKTYGFVLVLPFVAADGDRTLPPQSESSDTWKSSKMLILHRCYKHFRLALINMFALLNVRRAFSPHRRKARTTFDMFIMYVMSMCYNISVFGQAFSLHKRKARAILHFKEVCAVAIKPQPLNLKP